MNNRISRIKNFVKSGNAVDLIIVATTRLAQALINFTTLLIIVNFTTKEVVGMYSASLNIILLLTLFLQLGIPQSLMRDMVSRSGNEDSILKYYSKMLLFIPITMIGVIFGLDNLLGLRITEEMPGMLILTSIILVWINLSVFYMRSKFEHRLATTVENVLKPTAILISTAITLSLISQTSLSNLITAYLLAAIVTLTIAFTLDRFKIPQALISKRGYQKNSISYNLNKMLPAVKLAITGFLTQAVLVIDVITTEILIGPSAAAELKIAVSMATLTCTFGTAIHYLAIPRLSLLAKTHNANQVFKSLKLYLLMNLFLISLPWLTASYCIPFLLEIFFGQDYQASNKYYVQLFPAYLLIYTTGLISATLLALREDKFNIVIYLSMVLIFVLLCLAKTNLTTEDVIRNLLISSALGLLISFISINLVLKKDELKNA